MSLEAKIAARNVTRTKTMMAIYTILTRGNIDIIYPGVPADDHEILIRKMQHRLNFWISEQTGIEMKKCRHLNQLDEDDQKDVIRALMTLESFDEVRTWWYSGGSELYYKKREEYKEAERNKSRRQVIRVNDEGFAKFNEQGEYVGVVQKPSECTAFAHDADLQEVVDQLPNAKVILIGVAGIERN